MIFVVASIVLKSGQRSDFVAKARELVIQQTRGEAGCLFYDLTESTSDPNLAIFVERWESRAALEAHFGSPHMAAWRSVSGPMIETRTVEVIHPDRIEAL